MTRFPFVAALALVAGLAGCVEDQTVTPPDLSNNAGLFQRYVAVGTSISAGLQSGGINDSTQQLAFPVLVARQAGAPFGYPSLTKPGCPPPLVSNTAGIRVGGDTESASCAFRSQPVPAYLNSLAVPGLSLPDMFSNVATPVSSYERLQLFFLGGMVPITALMERQPTLVTVEIGANDVTTSIASGGDPGARDSITPPEVFTPLFATLADSLDRTGAKVLVGTVPDPTLLPFASRGLIYWCLKNGCGAPINIPANPVFQALVRFTVSNNCAPLGAGGAPNPFGQSLVPWTIGIGAALRSGRPPFPAFTLDCTNTALVVTPDEQAYIASTVAADNAAIRQEADARGWAVVDINGILGQLRQAGAIPLFPIVPPPDQLAAGASITFGPYFSLDGLHPNAALHRILADSVIASLNRTYGTSIPQLPAD